MAENNAETILKNVNEIEDPNDFFTYFKKETDAANDQQQLDNLRELLLITIKQEQSAKRLAAITASMHYIDTAYDDLPRKNYRYCNELFAHGFFCFAGTIIILLALLSILTPANLIIGPTFVLLGLSIGFTFKNAIQYLGSPGILKQPTEFSKLILSLTVTAEIAFYNLSDISELSIQTNDIFTHHTAMTARHRVATLGL